MRKQFKMQTSIEIVIFILQFHQSVTVAIMDQSLYSTEASIQQQPIIAMSENRQTEACIREVSMGMQDLSPSTLDIFMILARSFLGGGSSGGGGQSTNALATIPSQPGGASRPCQQPTSNSYGQLHGSLDDSSNAPSGSPSWGQRTHSEQQRYDAYIREDQAKTQRIKELMGSIEKKLKEMKQNIQNDLRNYERQKYQENKRDKVFPNRLNEEPFHQRKYNKDVVLQNRSTYSRDYHLSPPKADKGAVVPSKSRKLNLTIIKENVSLIKANVSLSDEDEIASEEPISQQPNVTCGRIYPK